MGELRPVGLTGALNRSRKNERHEPQPLRVRLGTLEDVRIIEHALDQWALAGLPIIAADNHFLEYALHSMKVGEFRLNVLEMRGGQFTRFRTWSVLLVDEPE